MQENLLYSLNVILPVFILAALGFGLARVGFFSDAFLRCAEKLVFRVALPAMLFEEIAGTRLRLEESLRLVVFTVVSVTAAFAFIALLSGLVIRDRSKRGAFVQGACRSNFAVLGIPLAQSMFGSSGTELIALLMPFVIIMFNGYSVITLSLFSDARQKKKPAAAAKELIVNIITNPLIISALIAVPFAVTGAKLPLFADRALTYTGNLATPLALICLGANFKKDKLRGRAGAAASAALIKTVLLPAAAVFAAVLLGFRGVSLGVLFILFASPSAVSSYIMAKNMNNDSDLAAQILLFSTGVCVITVFTGVFILKSLSLI